MRKIFNNKPDYDPGRFRATLEFLKQTSVPNSSGGSTPSTTVVKTLKAVEIQVNDGSQLAINAGASVMNQDKYFVIRKETFYPKKGMNVRESGRKYVIRSIGEEGQPVKYLRLLCVRSDGD